MTRDDVLAAFDRIRVWQQGDRRAVHKPLLVLLALARDTTLVAEIARRILNAHFPESIRDAFASKLAPTAAASAGTICAWAVMNGWKRLSLEAAHIKWFQAIDVDGRTWCRTASRFVRCTTRSSTSARSPCCLKTTRSCSAAT